MKQRQQGLKATFTESFLLFSLFFFQMLVHTTEIKFVQTHVSFCIGGNWWNRETPPWAGGWRKRFAVSRKPDSTIETEPTYFYCKVFDEMCPVFLGALETFGVQERTVYKTQATISPSKYWWRNKHLSKTNLFSDGLDSFFSKSLTLTPQNCLRNSDTIWHASHKYLCLLSTN